MKLSLIVISIVCILLLATFSVPAVQAVGSIVYTSTADFDGGNKSDPGQDYFVANGVDQPTYSFVSKPAAIYSSVVDRTYIVYEGDAGFVPYIVYYDHTLAQWSDPVIVNDTNPVSGDGHGAPAMWIDSSGYIYVFYGAHATAMQLKRSTNVYNISSWTQLSSPTPGSPPSNQGTYPHLFEHGGYIYFFYRQGTAAGGDWGFRRSNDFGVSWSSFTMTLDFGTDGLYIGDHVYVASQSRVYYTFVWDNRVEIKRHNAYVCYWDLTTNTQFGIDGVNLGPLVTLAEANTNCRAAYTGSGIGGFSNMKLDSSNRPYVLFVNGTAVVYDTYNITFVSWNGSAWSVQQNITNTDATSGYTDFIVHSPTSIEAFLTTAGFRQLFDPADDFNGDLERWTWNGSTWTYQETIMYEEKSGLPVNRPHVPLNHVPEITIIFDSWLPKNLLAPQAKIWAWGSNGLVFRTETPSDTLGIETLTDNLQISNGTFQLSNGNSDTFATSSSDASSYKWSNIPTGDDNLGIMSKRFVNGTYNVTVTNPGSTGRLGSTLVGNFGVTGVFDVRVKFNDTIPESDPGGNTFYALCMFSQPDECDSVSGALYVGTNGVYWQFSPSVPWFTSFKVNNINNDGWVEEIGSTAFVSCGPPCWLRITKTGTTWTFYRSTDGTAWAQHSQQVIANFTASTWYVHLEIHSNGVNDGNTWAAEVDDYNLVTGSLNTNGYRPIGSWKSPLQTYNGEVAKSIVVGYSGATSTKYIDEIAVVDSQDNVLFADGTNRISGTSANFTIGDNDFLSLFGKDWSVRVTLAGDGSGSVIVNDITVYTVRSTLTIAISDAPWIIGFFALISLGLAGALALKKKRGNR